MRRKNARSPFLEYWYRRYNRLYFHGRLPRDVKIYWADFPVRHSGVPKGNRTRRLAEMCYDKGSHDGILIFFNRRLCPGGVRSPSTYATLLHEMIHVKLAIRLRLNDHGYVFRREWRRLVRSGAFDNLW